MTLPDDELPFPLSDVSNGEWCPRPPSPAQVAAYHRLIEEADRRAARLGLSRRQFLRTAAGTATAFMVLNEVHGLAASGDAAVLPVTAEQCDDPQAARELFSKDYFVVDVQLHHVDLERYNTPLLAFLRFLEPQLSADERLQHLSQLNMVKEVFVDSDTAVGVISGVPNGVPLPVDTMAQTRDLVNALAGSPRALSQAMCDPRTPPGSQTALDSLERQVRELGAVALKCYTGNGAWWLDDEQVAYPMLEEATRLGLRVVNVHKGLPSLLGEMAETYVQSRDLPKVSYDWPRLEFVAYHSGYFQGVGIGEFLGVVNSIRGRRNVHAEIGSAFALAFLESPASAAHLVGSLLKALGPERIVWGTDSIWWGSPQWQIQAFKTLTIPPAMQEEFGYPALDEHAKRRILGLNAARLYRIQPSERRCAIDADRLSAARQALGGPEATRSLLAYGPRTRRDFLRIWNA
ncbi:MAG: amidohydrolase family protein [Deltaproteobacteria bacterium]|nr:amidohydrolase family protein [Deltaproteobacteria bacterium]